MKKIRISGKVTQYQIDDITVSKLQYNQGKYRGQAAIFSLGKVID